MTSRIGLAEQASIIVEGAVDRFCGRPQHANPYSPEYAAEAWHASQFGWTEADWYLDIRGQEEARRWLGDAGVTDRLDLVAAPSSATSTPRARLADGRLDTDDLRGWSRQGCRRRRGA